MTKRRWGAAALAGAVLAAGAAQAALPPQYYLKARETAPLHLQVRLTEVGGGEGTCVLKGEAVERFRGGRAGEVSFTVQCQNRGVTPMPGPDVWFDPEAFRPGVVLEGFFVEAGEGRIAPALGQMAVVPAVRDRPWCAVAEFRCDLP